MFDAKTLNRQNLKGPIIGAVQVHIPFRHHKADYECAAWWEDHEACQGVHPVYLGRSYHDPQHLNITADIKAKVVNDYFPALWCGNHVSNKPYQPKYIGHERIIRSSIDIVDAIQQTGASPGNELSNHLDWFIHPSWWELFVEEALTNLREDYRRLPEFWQAWDNLKQETWKPAPYQDGERWSFRDEYRSKIGMVAHFGKELEFWARRIEKITWHSQYHSGRKYDTAYHRDLFSSNTEWTKAIPIQVNS